MTSVYISRWSPYESPRNAQSHETGVLISAEGVCNLRQCIKMQMAPVAPSPRPTACGRFGVERGWAGEQHVCPEYEKIVPKDCLDWVAMRYKKYSSWRHGTERNLGRNAGNANPTGTRKSPNHVKPRHRMGQTRPVRCQQSETLLASVVLLLGVRSARAATMSCPHGFGRTAPGHAPLLAASMVLAAGGVHGANLVHLAAPPWAQLRQCYRNAS